MPATVVFGIMGQASVGLYRLPGHEGEPSVHDRDIVAAIMEGDSTGVAAAFGRYAEPLYSSTPGRSSPSPPTPPRPDGIPSSSPQPRSSG